MSILKFLGIQPISKLRQRYDDGEQEKFFYRIAYFYEFSGPV